MPCHFTLVEFVQRRREFGDFLKSNAVSFSRFHCFAVAVMVCGRHSIGPYRGIDCTCIQANFYIFVFLSFILSFSIVHSNKKLISHKFSSINLSNS